MKWLLDTTVLVDYSRGRQAAVQWLTQRVDECAISVVTLAELAQGARNEAEQQALGIYAQVLALLPVNAEVAWAAGALCRRYRASHNCQLPDGLIAATAQVHGLQLATHNLKHYPMFAGLEAPY